MIESFIFICIIVAVVYLVNLVFVLSGIFLKKKPWKARLNPYKFFSRLFRNFNDGYGTDVRVGILPIILTIMTIIGLWSIITRIFT